MTEIKPVTDLYGNESFYEAFHPIQSDKIITDNNGSTWKQITESGWQRQKDKFFWPSNPTNIDNTFGSLPPTLDEVIIMRQPPADAINYTNLSDTSLEKCYHVIVPRNSRKSISIEFSNSVSHINLSSIFEKTIVTLRKEAKKRFIQYLGYTESESSSDDTVCYILYYIDIESELLVKLKKINITNIIIYIGLSEDPQKCPVLDGVPLDEMIAKYDRSGLPAVYVTPEICIG